LPFATAAFVFLSPTNPNTSEIATNQSAAASTTASANPPLLLKIRTLPVHQQKEMAKSDAQKKTGFMVKEWWKSKSNEQTIEDLVTMGVLHNKELTGWRAPEGEGYPDPQPGEIMVFEDFFKRGFGVPVHPFLQGLCLYYEIGICNLHPNLILLVATFIHLCEAYGGF